MTFYSFHRIKGIIQSKVGIHPHEYSLYYSGKHVPDFQYVASLNIEGAEATIQMIANRNDNLSFLVETPTQNTIEVEVKCNHTVLTLKNVVESMTNCPSEDWDLFSGSTRLWNAKTLAYYEIKENEILKMLLIDRYRRLILWAYN
ncbi:hypothetical protein EZV62_000936 [Acer yangbiense]|uniref:Ubiquitin-like domain-containing protein n=1 Tax=Acer yangbiense TaxID=1000413 RepID=A0A5C7ISN3_9ROSI|nr:hypothetical protein EZV62_000936 [Acer yangbiense]